MTKEQKLIEKLKELIKMIAPHGAEFWGDDSDVYFNLTKEIASLEAEIEQEEKTVSDIIDCIIRFDKTETLKVKGRYFEVIQRDLCKLQNK